MCGVTRCTHGNWLIVTPLLSNDRRADVDIVYPRVYRSLAKVLDLVSLTRLEYLSRVARQIPVQNLHKTQKLLDLETKIEQINLMVILSIIILSLQEICK